MFTEVNGAAGRRETLEADSMLLSPLRRPGSIYTALENSPKCLAFE